MKFSIKPLAFCAAIVCSASVLAQQGETVKIAMIEGLSGPMGNVGQNQLQGWQYLSSNLPAELNPAGVKFEIVPMDSKTSPQEALNLLKVAIDQGIRYVTQGNGSSVAVPLSEAIAKHNQRNPGKEVIYINYSAVDPVLTNEKCNWWHFRFDADTSMKMSALTSFVKDQPSEKIYLVNQNYSHGHQVAKYFKEGLAKNKPQAKIVGEDYVPLGQVKDFSPYVAKIKAAGADSVVSGSWGQDFTLLVKAMNDAGLKLPIYAYYAGVIGTPTALAAGGDDLEVYQISYGHSNYDGLVGKIVQDFKKQFNAEFYTFSIYNSLTGLSHAMAKAGSTDPVKVAAALSGLQFKGHNGDSEMRDADHQFQQGLWITKWEKATDKYPNSVEGTGYNFAPVKYIEREASSTPTVCKMKRPG